MCNVSGMVCLSQHMEWYNTSKWCDCLPACNSVQYIKGFMDFLYEVQKFERTIKASLHFPKSRIKRNVLFTEDNLLGMYNVHCTYILNNVIYMYLFVEIIEFSSV